MATEIPTEDLLAEVENLRSLLREARQYVYDAEVPYEHLYDDQQALLKKIDEAAPEPVPTSPPELCGKEGPHGAPCLSDKGHEGDCDDLPF